MSSIKIPHTGDTESLDRCGRRGDPSPANSPIIHSRLAQYQKYQKVPKVSKENPFLGVPVKCMSAMHRHPQKSLWGPRAVQVSHAQAPPQPCKQYLKKNMSYLAKISNSECFMMAQTHRRTHRQTIR